MSISNVEREAKVLQVLKNSTFLHWFAQRDPRPAAIGFTAMSHNKKTRYVIVELYAGYWRSLRDCTELATGSLPDVIESVKRCEARTIAPF